jgi:hypothetical protein
MSFSARPLTVTWPPAATERPHPQPPLPQERGLFVCPFLWEKRDEGALLSFAQQRLIQQRQAQQVERRQRRALLDVGA